MRQLRAEWIKLVTVRTTWVLSILTAGLSLVLAVLLIRVVDQITANGGPTPLGLLANCVTSFAFLPGIVGVLVYGAEYRHGTFRATYAAEPNRWRVAVAKTLVVIGFGVLVAAVTVAVTVGVGYPFLASKGFAPPFDGVFTRSIVGAGLFIVFNAVAGLALGATVRNRTVAIILLIAVPVALESVLVALLPHHLGRFLPFVAGAQMYSTGPVTAGTQLSPLLGGLVFAAWIAADLVLGIALAVRRDTH
jgi:ABC-2 type transport system permease protein